MRKIILYLGISLDGYIADHEGGVSFLEGDGSDVTHQGTYDAFIKEVDTIIMGYKTYRQVKDELSPNVWPYSNQLTYVITSKTFTHEDHIELVNDPSIAWFNDIKHKKGKHIFLCGGAQIFNLCHKLGVIDQYRIQVMPVMLGQGIRLFDLYEFQEKLKLMNVITYNGMVEMMYEKR